MRLPALLDGKKHVSTSSTEAPNNPEGYDALERDVAFTLVGEHAQAIDPVVEARVVRKIDMFLIPAMIIGMLLISSTTATGSIGICESNNGG